MTILIVQRLVREEKLCHFSVDGTVDLEMNMGRAHITTGGRIWAGLDGCERVAAVAVGTQHGIALKIGIDGQLRVRIRGVCVPAIRVCLPQLDACMPHRLTTQIHDAAAELDHLTRRSLAVTANRRQVHVGITWLDLRVERAGNQVGRLAASDALGDESGGWRHHRYRGKRGDLGPVLLPRARVAG